MSTDGGDGEASLALKRQGQAPALDEIRGRRDREDGGIRIENENRAGKCVEVGDLLDSPSMTSGTFIPIVLGYLNQNISLKAIRRRLPHRPTYMALLSDRAPKTTPTIINVPKTIAVAIALGATPSRAAPTRAHDEKGT